MTLINNYNMPKLFSKEHLSKAFDIFGINSLCNLIRGLLVDDLRILAYHRICNLDECYDNDIDLISATEAQFDWQVSYLKKNYNLIGFEELYKIINKEMKCPKRPVIITFDDGFADNYVKAYPILKKYNASATFFVSTGYIGTENHFWFNQVFRCLLNCDYKKVTIADLGIDMDLSSDQQVRYSQIYEVVKILQRTSNNKRIKAVKYLEANYPSRKMEDALSLPLSWEHLKEMSDNGMEVGSHTIGHSILSQLTEDELRYELEFSKQILEDKLERAVTTIAYPVGLLFAYNDDVVAKTSVMNYKFGISYMPGNNYFKSLNKFDLKRIHIERYTSNSMFKSMLSLPELFAKH